MLELDLATRNMRGVGCDVATSLRARRVPPAPNKRPEHTMGDLSCCSRSSTCSHSYFSARAVLCSASPHVVRACSTHVPLSTASPSCSVYSLALLHSLQPRRALASTASPSSSAFPRGRCRALPRVSCLVYALPCLPSRIQSSPAKWSHATPQEEENEGVLQGRPTAGHRIAATSSTPAAGRHGCSLHLQAEWPC